LSVWFRDRVGKLKGRIRRITIVAVARKLLIALWRYLEISVSRLFDGVVGELFDGGWCAYDRYPDVTERAVVLAAVKDAARR
jgi:hypothetical protein